MKLLCEINKENGILVSATPDGTALIDPVESSVSCIVDDELSDRIWQAHIHGIAVTIVIDNSGAFVSADIAPVELPPALPSLEEVNAMLTLELAETQFRLDQAEQAQAELIFNLVEKGVL